MIKYYTYTPQDVIKKTSQVIHLFYNRNIEPIAEMLYKDFVWIGAYEFQYLQGKKEFLNSIKSESQEKPVHLSQEEFQLLAHEKNIWTVYGRFIATVILEDNTILLAKIRNTFVWKQEKDELILMHIHGSHARDVPLEFTGDQLPSIIADSSWFDYVKGVDQLVGPPKKLIFRDQHGTYRFVLPSEIVYVKAEHKQCTIFTGNDSFVSRISLKELGNKSPLLLQIHRSYLVNNQCVKSIQRYQMKLTGGLTLPISKERYMNVKEQIKASNISI